MMHPGARLLQQEQRLDDLEQRLTGAMRGALHHSRSRVSEATSSLLAAFARATGEGYVPQVRIARGAFADTRWNDRAARAEHRLALAARTLNTVSPLATLDRGFAIVTRGADGVLVTDAASLQVGDEIDARIARGKVRARDGDWKRPIDAVRGNHEQASADC